MKHTINNLFWRTSNFRNQSDTKLSILKEKQCKLEEHENNLLEIANHSQETWERNSNGSSLLSQNLLTNIARETT